MLVAEDHGFGTFPKQFPLLNLLLEQVPGAPASLFWAGNQQLYYWSTRTCFYLTQVHFPPKHIMLIWSGNFSLAGRWGRINMTAESSRLETKKAGMESKLFCKQTSDMGDLSTCCLHKSTCWHCAVGLPRDSLKMKPIKICKIHGNAKSWA